MFKSTFALMFLAAFAFGAAGCDDSGENSTADQGPIVNHIVQDVMGCRDKDVFAKMVKTAAEDDTVALGKMSIPAMASGECVKLSGGEPVFLEGVSREEELVMAQVRPRGDVVSYLTYSQSVGK